MEIAMIGLGKMGGNMSRRLIKGGHTVIGYNLYPEATDALAEEVGLVPAYSLEELVSKFTSEKRACWIMVPAGKPTEMTVEALKDLLDPGDIIIDGGNSNFNETKARAKDVNKHGIAFIDVGTSGGVWGLTNGYSMMVGGSDDAVKYITPALETLAPGKDKGWGHVGPNGSGHYVKMVHNGIEYGMMQAYAEGFDLMRHKEEFELDMHQISQIWRFGSVIQSWLLDLTANALSDDQDLTDLDGFVPDSGEGRWTVIDSIEQAVPTPVITLALQMRFASRDSEQYWAKMLSAMRGQFGGHAVKKAD